MFLGNKNYNKYKQHMKYDLDLDRLIKQLDRIDTLYTLFKANLDMNTYERKGPQSY